MSKHTDLNILENPPSRYWVEEMERSVGIEYADGRRLVLRSSDLDGYWCILHACEAGGAAFCGKPERRGDK